MDHPLSLVAVFVAWIFWAAFRAWYEFWSFLARKCVRTPRATGGVGFTLPLRWKVLTAIAYVGLFFSGVVAKLARACPACFHHYPCPYHWTKLVGQNYGRVLPNRRQRQAERRGASL